jgi:hypothetical protein
MGTPHGMQHKDVQACNTLSVATYGPLYVLLADSLSSTLQGDDAGVAAAAAAAAADGEEQPADDDDLLVDLSSKKKKKKKKVGGIWHGSNCKDGSSHHAHVRTTLTAVEAAAAAMLI